MTTQRWLMFFRYDPLNLNIIIHDIQSLFMKRYLVYQNLLNRVLLTNP